MVVRWSRSCRRDVSWPSVGDGQSTKMCVITRRNAVKHASDSLVFAVEHQRKTNSNLSPAVFPQLQSEEAVRALAGGEGQPDTNLQATARGGGMLRVTQANTAQPGSDGTKWNICVVFPVRSSGCMMGTRGQRLWSLCTPSDNL